MLRTDLHCHLLWGIDDGSRSPAESVAMARGLVATGVRRVFATPHQYRFGNVLSPATVASRVALLRRTLAAASVSLEVTAGAECLYGSRLLEALDKGEELVTFPFLGETCLLVELPLRHPAVGVACFGALLMRRGIRPILAHPERTARARHDLDRIRRWRDAGWWLQLNLRSLVGDHGPLADYVATHLLADGAYAGAGSDLHGPRELARLRTAHARFRRLALSETTP